MSKSERREKKESDVYIKPFTVFFDTDPHMQLVQVLENKGFSIGFIDSDENKDDMYPPTTTAYYAAPEEVVKIWETVEETPEFRLLVQATYPFNQMNHDYWYQGNLSDKVVWDEKTSSRVVALGYKNRAEYFGLHHLSQYARMRRIAHRENPQLRDEILHYEKDPKVEMYEEASQLPDGEKHLTPSEIGKLIESIVEQVMNKQ